MENAEIIENIEESTRKLASIQQIETIKPIAGADRIQVCTMKNLGWECVIKKDEHKVGDLIVYIECDSILPQRPEFEFMRERKFRVRTIKLKKQISSGLIMPLSILPIEIEQFCGNLMVVWDSMDETGKKIPVEIGLDVTKILQISKHDPEGKLEQALVEKQKRSKLMRFMMNIPAFRWAYLKLNSNVKGNWPSWIQRTDETRIQVCAKLIMEHYDEDWEITEKLDGQSATFFVHPMKVWGLTRNKFGVCSRKIWLKTPSDSKYWQSARKYKIENALKEEGNDLYSQAEQCGPGIQSNKYKLSGVELYFFNLVISGNRVSYSRLLNFCQKHGLKPVPLINSVFNPKKEIGENKSVMDVVNHMIKLSQGNSALLNRPKEGIVMRLKSNPEISLKIINPEFKIEQEKEEDNE